MRRFLPLFPVLVASVLLAGGAYAVTRTDVVARLGGAVGDIFDLDGALRVNSLTVGDQGSGGVTFFNGTIVNSTTDANGNGIPVTFGDDVRVDGKISRLPGQADKPVTVNDDLLVQGDVTADNLYTKNAVDTALTTKADIVDTYSKDEVDALVADGGSGTQTLTLAAASFIPLTDSFSYTSSTGSLIDPWGLIPQGINSWFSAQAFLPADSTVTKLTYYGIDNGSGHTEVDLRVCVLPAQNACSTNLPVSTTGVSSAVRPFTKTGSVSVPSGSIAFVRAYLNAPDGDPASEALLQGAVLTYTTE